MLVDALRRRFISSRSHVVDILQDATHDHCIAVTHSLAEIFNTLLTAGRAKIVVNDAPKASFRRLNWTG